MHTEHLPPYLTIQKSVGETPLQALERLRELHDIPTTIPLAYAGRLDPMASGTLLVLVGDTCKKQSEYHSLDKTYEFEILFGIQSDTGDVLGLVEKDTTNSEHIRQEKLAHEARKLVGNISLPYPHFSSKEVRGKPLHIWALEGRLNEIEIPTKHSRIYSLSCHSVRDIHMDELYTKVIQKIETIPKVTEASKALGADFRRDDVRAHWKDILDSSPESTFKIATCTATVSSGTYIRSLAPLIAKQMNTCGLAYSIHRTHIGKYTRIGPFGFWSKKF